MENNFKNNGDKLVRKDSKLKFTTSLLSEWDSMCKAYMFLKNGGKIVTGVINGEECKFVK